LDPAVASVSSASLAEALSTWGQIQRTLEFMKFETMSVSIVHDSTLNDAPSAPRQRQFDALPPEARIPIDFRQR
jgi:hypothetical protein